VWEWKVPAYLFAGGLSAGSAVLAAGADLTGRLALRRASRVSALASLAASTYFLIADLGRPERFHHMLRVAKPTSPMSVGTWILAAYGPGVGVAAAAELLPAALQRTMLGRPLRQLSRPAGLSATGKAHQLRTCSECLTTAGLIGTAVAARRSRALVVISGLALLAGSLLQRLGIFEAGVASTKDPRYVIVPQRQRLNEEPGRACSPDASAPDG
jgi:hypothetical protein